MQDAEGARAVGRQRWRDLLFLHWPVPLDALRPLVPRGLEIDSFAGESYVSLIPFEIIESRPEGAPRVMASHFLETNVRTYVRDADGEPGVYFFSLEASSLLAVTVARLLFGLPYFHAAMCMRREGAEIQYTSRRRGSRDATIEVAWSIGDALDAAADGSRDHFLIERYSLYVARHRGLYRGRVRHRPYPLRRVTVKRLRQTLLSAAALPAPSAPPIAHYSPGVDVEIFWLKRVKGVSR